MDRCPQCSAPALLVAWPQRQRPAVLVVPALLRIVTAVTSIKLASSIVVLIITKIITNPPCYTVGRCSGCRCSSCRSSGSTAGTWGSWHTPHRFSDFVLGSEISFAASWPLIWWITIAHDTLAIATGCCMGSRSHVPCPNYDQSHEPLHGQLQ